MVRGSDDEDDQVRRLTRYTKAWKDVQRNNGTKVAKGLALTILIAETFVADLRDDVAFAKTIDTAYRRLSSNITIKKPVTPFEDLTAAWTQTQRTNFLDRLKQLRDYANDAVAETDKVKASKLWRRVLGERFPEAEPAKTESTNALRTTAPAILGNDGRSA